MLGITSSSRGQIQQSVIDEGGVLNVDQQLLLLWTVSEAEIKEALWSILIHKSPRHDGHRSGFYRQAWEIIRCDVVHMVQLFFKTGKLHNDLNATHLVLLPKSDSPSAAADYRPIACGGVIYKIFAKILSNKLQLVLPTLVSQSQAAFVSGWHIL